jgi:LPS O-antigen subunit length determinant protein (WzzB/FepE family)
VFLLTIHPAAPAPTPHSSVAAWVVLAIVLGVVLACGMVLTSRR